jgi:CDP-diacylglycerol--glycerol-3-phosphate 3-phosphatidyltransferase
MNENQIDKNSKAYKFAAGKGVMNLPNKLTISRVIMIPIFVVLFYVHFTGHYFVSLAVFAIACLTDFFDGRIARKYNLVTNLGKFLDPIADKVLVSTAMIVMLTKPEFFNLYLGNWAIIVAGCCVAIILGRELIVSGFRMVAANSGLVIAADKIGKYKTTAQDFSLVILLVFAGCLEVVNSEIALQVLNFIGLGLFALATILTIISGVNYIVKNIQVLKA